MPIYKNDRKIVKIYKNDRSIGKVYKGNSEVFTQNQLPPNLRQVSYLEGNFQNLTIDFPYTLNARKAQIKTTFLINTIGQVGVDVGFISFNNGILINLIGYDYLNHIYGVYNFRLNDSDRMFGISNETKYNLSCKSGEWFLNGDFKGNGFRNITLSRVRLGYSGKSFRLYNFSIKDIDTSSYIINLIPCLDIEANLPCFFNKATGAIIYVPSDVKCGAFVLDDLLPNKNAKQIGYLRPSYLTTMYIPTNSPKYTGYDTTNIKLKINFAVSTRLSYFFGFEEKIAVSIYNETNQRQIECSCGSSYTFEDSTFESLIEISATPTIKTFNQTSVQTTKISQSISLANLSCPFNSDFTFYEMSIYSNDQYYCYIIPIQFINENGQMRYAFYDVISKTISQDSPNYIEKGNAVE